MINELNLYKLFEDIITKSKVMKRFIVAPKYGVELNKNNASEILTDILGGIKDGIKYPICLMFPPIEVIEDLDKGWSRFKCKLFFLTTEFNDRNGTQNVNLNNNLSKHTIQMTWKDMRLCAVDFLRVFKLVTEKDLSVGIREAQTVNIIERYSDIGNDRSAGVGISFDIDVFLGCELEDYTETEINLININTDNLHPSHDH